MPSRDSPRLGADRHRRRLPRPVERSADDARVAEVVAHQPLDPLPRLGAGIAQQLAPSAPASRGSARSGCAAPRDAASIARAAGSPRPRRGAPGRRGPGRSSSGSVSIAIVRVGREIAKRAGRFLHVGLELVQRVVEARVALVDQALAARRGCTRACRRRERPRREAIEQRSRRRRRPRVEQRQQELGVVGFEPREVVQLANLMADRRSQVPQRMQEWRGRVPPPRPDGRRTAGGDRRPSAGRDGAGRSRRARRRRSHRRRRARPRTAVEEDRRRNRRTAEAPRARPRRARPPPTAPRGRFQRLTATSPSAAMRRAQAATSCPSGRRRRRARSSGRRRSPRR